MTIHINTTLRQNVLSIQSNLETTNLEFVKRNVRMLLELCHRSLRGRLQLRPVMTAGRPAYPILLLYYSYLCHWK